MKIIKNASYRRDYNLLFEMTHEQLIDQVKLARDQRDSYKRELRHQRSFNQELKDKIIKIKRLQKKQHKEFKNSIDC